MPIRALPLLLSIASLVFDQAPVKRHLYIGTPDAAQNDYRSGQGILVFDIDQGHKFVRRIDIPAFKTVFAASPETSRRTALTFPPETGA